ncbi:hypothetical protein C8J57DRAFT_1390732 [Mycena rebaudengoi]|nr:hypothetical protein C8J57DRAFT_1390732 [Mycena rebaudengoi]
MRQAHLGSFPVEILSEIVERTSFTDQISLSVASRLLSAIALRFLYRTIRLTSLVHTVRCCTTLAQNSLLALAVRTIRIQTPRPAHAFTVLSSFFRLLNSALLKTTNITSLAIDVVDLNASILRGCILPKLEQFECLSFCQPHFAFLASHPTIKTLYLWPEHFDQEFSGSLNLPALSNFTGPSALVPALLSGAPVQAVSLRWPRWERSQAESVIPQLARSTFPQGVSVFQNLFYGWPSLSALTLMAHSLAHVLSLSLISADLPDPGSLSYNELVEGFSDHLPQFRCLLSVTIDYGSPGRPAPPVDYDLELARMQDWGRLSPTLVSCTLISRVRWDRIGHRTAMWLPAEQPRALVNPWLSKTLTQRGTQGTSDFLADVRDILVELNPDRLDDGLMPVIIKSLVVMPRLAALQVLLNDISDEKVDFLFSRRGPPPDEPEIVEL